MHGFFQAFDCYAKSTDSDEKINIVFINPGKSDPAGPTGGFWREVTRFMEAAADDLGVDLEILYAERNHILMKQLAEMVLSREKLPDYLFVVNEKLAAGKIIELAESKGVETFVLLVGFYGKQAAQLGEPRVKYKKWIGGLVPDNRWAGYKLAKSLIHEAVDKGYPANKIKVFPVYGDYATQATIERGKGLEDAKKDFSDVVFLPKAYCMWRKDMAFDMALKFLHRDPAINVVWAANDPMALGACAAAVGKGLIPGKNFFAGGINWDLPALKAVESGKQAVSIGGHFMTGGWGLIMVYDYHHGHDFAGSGSPMVQKRIFDLIDSRNAGPFLKKFGDRDWSKVDFKKFSKAYNSSLKEYDFSIKALMKH